MKNQPIEQFANQIREKNRIKSSIRKVYLYVVFLVWFTYCFVIDYSLIGKGHISITCVVFAVVACSMSLYSWNFYENYISVAGKGGKINQDIAECIARMPFSVNEYMAYISKRLRQKLLLTGGGMIGCLFLGLFVCGKVDNIEQILNFQWDLPSHIGKAICFLCAASVCMSIAIIVVYYFWKTRYQKLMLDFGMAEKRKRTGKYSKILKIAIGAFVVAGVIFFLGVISILFRNDPDPMLTLSMYIFLVIIVLIKYWYILCPMGCIVLVLGIMVEKRRRQGKTESRLFKIQTFMLHAFLFGLAELVLLFSVRLVLPLEQHEKSVMYETTDQSQYGRFSGHYEGEEADRFAGLFVFPKMLSTQAENVEYYYGANPMFFDHSYEIYLQATYPKDIYEKEKERLSDIECTIKINAEGDKVTNHIQCMEEQSPYPAYVAICDYDGIYEYALLDEDNCRIIYVYMQYCDGENVPEEYWLVKNDTREGDVWYEGEDDFNLYYAEDENGDFSYYKD